MHASAFEKARLLRSAYLADYESLPLTVLDVGSAVVAEGHPSNRQAMANPGWRYIGLDIEPGINVDVAVAEPYDWREVADASVDVVTCSQVFEHTEFLWITILEIGRVLRPNGLAFIIAPGSGPLHRYPVDCWRFYDDGLPALAKWALLRVVESRVQWQPVYGKGDMWRDAAIVLQRPVRTAAEEAAAAARTRLAKAALLGGETVPVPVPAPGVIAEAPARNALLGRENALRDEAGVLGQRMRQAGTQLRALRAALFGPLRDPSQG